MRSIDLDSLEIFRAVAQEGGVIRAAQKLNRVQSNVTTRVKQLEQRLGCPLFRRQGRGLVLSPEGERLLVYAQRLFRLADEAESELRSGKPAGVLRIGSLESTAGSRLAPILSRFHTLYPDVVVELATGTTGALVHRVSNFELDAAFVSQPFTAPSLNAMKVFEEELVCWTRRCTGQYPGCASPIDRHAGDLERRHEYLLPKTQSSRNRRHSPTFARP